MLQMDLVSVVGSANDIWLLIGERGQGGEGMAAECGVWGQSRWRR